MEDRKIVRCKTCNVLKEATLSGTFDGVNKRWVDSNGKLFNGKVCPDCHKEKQKNNIKAKRNGVTNA